VNHLMDDSKEQIDDILKNTKKLSEELIELCPGPVNLEPDSPFYASFQSQFQNLRPVFPRYLSLWRRFAFTLEGLAHDQKCASTTCRRFHRTPRLCMGCGFVRFCSRYCQKQAWRHAEVPHRDICFLLAKARTSINIPSQGLLTDLLSRRSIPASKFFEPLANMVFDHFRALTELELKNLGPYHLRPDTLTLMLSFRLNLEESMISLSFQ
jgi:hypothetical protein